VTELVSCLQFSHLLYNFNSFYMVASNGKILIIALLILKKCAIIRCFMKVMNMPHLCKIF